MSVEALVLSEKRGAVVNFKKVRRIALRVMLVLIAVFLVEMTVLVFISLEQNKTIMVTEYTVTHAEIPAAFEGKRIVHLTDLHNKDHGTALSELVRRQNPDLILITGDWITRTNDDITTAKRQAELLVGIAPIYYVAGNHEAMSPHYAELSIHLQSLGIEVLQNRAVDWTVEGESIQLVGLFDPDFGYLPELTLPRLIEEEAYSILLYHRPELLETVSACGADLVLSGHTHGGQIRLPLIGAVYGPDQGLFPKYDVGRFQSGDTEMIISQGLGEGAYMRILTPPEVVVITLDSPHV